MVGWKDLCVSREFRWDGCVGYYLVCESDFVILYNGFVCFVVVVCCLSFVGGDCIVID